MASAAESSPVGSGAAASPQGQGQAPQKPKRDDQRDGDLSSFIDELMQHKPSNLTTSPPSDALKLLSDVPACAKVLNALKNFRAKLPELIALSDDHAMKMKERGNTEFTSSNHDAAIMFYSRAMMHAESDQLLSTLLNNRSTALYSLSRFREAALDANEALKLQPEYEKALQRRWACIEKLGLQEKLSSSNIELHSERSSKATADAVYAELRYPATCPPFHPTAEVNEGIMMTASSEKGRYIVARQRLEAGTAVVVESPYAAAPLIEGLLSCCAHCFRRTDVLYPCALHRAAKKRSRGMFCSPECAEGYWTKYGKSESENPFFLVCPVDTLLALRLLRQIVRLRSNIVPSQFLGSALPATIDESNLFTPAYAKSLMQFSSEMYGGATVGGKETILSAIGVLFEVVSPESVDALVRAHRQVLANAISIGCLDRILSRPGTDQHVIMQVKLAKAIYFVGSTFNHSCDPNCAVHVKGEPYSSSAELHIRLIRPCMEGEELTVAYDGITKNNNHSTRARIRALRSAYGFNCICHACSNNVDEAIPKEDQEHYYKAADLYQKGRRLTREGNYTEALNVLGHSLDLVLKFICPPPRPPQLMVAKTHDAMAQVCQLTGDKAACRKHLLLAIDVLHEHHGTDDDALHREYMKIALLSKELGDMDMYQQYSNKAKALLQLHYPPSEHLDAEIKAMCE